MARRPKCLTAVLAAQILHTRERRALLSGCGPVQRTSDEWAAIFAELRKRRRKRDS